MRAYQVRRTGRTVARSGLGFKAYQDVAHPHNPSLVPLPGYPNANPNPNPNPNQEQKCGNELEPQV